MNDISKRISDLGLSLPTPPKSIGLYAPALITGDYLYLSGSGGADPRNLPVYGKVGKDVTVEEAGDCARGAVLALLSTAEKILGNLDEVAQIVKIIGFVNSADGFYDHPKVLDAASNLLLKIFGEEKGRHARSAVGVAGLPLNIPVEIEMIIEIRREKTPADIG